MNSDTTVAVIDVGSNSIKLLVARRGVRPGTLQTVLTQTLESRISAGISGPRPILGDAALRLGGSAIEQLFLLARDYHPSAVKIVATSAVRDALNGHEFVERVRAATGCDLRILSGEEEATYIGKGLACDPAIAGVADFIQTDIGGGSLELIRFENGRIERAISLQLGAVRLTEQFISDREAPVHSETATRIRAHVQDTIRATGFAFTPHHIPMIATGGAYAITRTLLAHPQDASTDAPSPTLTRQDISLLRAELCALTLDQRKNRPHLPPARADILPTALITIEALLELAERDQITHSFYNLRYGIAAELLNS